MTLRQLIAMFRAGHLSLYETWFELRLYPPAEQTNKLLLEAMRFRVEEQQQEEVA